MDNRLYEFGGTADVLIKCKSPRVIDGVEYKEGEPYTMLKDVVVQLKYEQRIVEASGVKPVFSGGDGRPYEIFTGIADDEEGILLPKSVTEGKIIKTTDEEGNRRYDFQYKNTRGYKTTVEGLSHKFDKEYWNYAKLISGVIRNGMPIVDILNLVRGLNLDDENINTWKKGVERALKQYIPDGTKDESGQKCEKCKSTNLIYTEGCLICQDCGHGKCG